MSPGFGLCDSTIAFNGLHDKPRHPNPPRAMSSFRSIVSVGQAAALVQAMPDRIHKAADALGVTPAMRINNVAYFTEGDVERIGEYLRSGAQQTAAS